MTIDDRLEWHLLFDKVCLYSTNQLCSTSPALHNGLSHFPLYHRRIFGDLLVVPAVGIYTRGVAGIHSDPRPIDHDTFVGGARFGRSIYVFLACQDRQVVNDVLLDVDDSVVESFAAEHGPVEVLAKINTWSIRNLVCLTYIVCAASPTRVARPFKLSHIPDAGFQDSRLTAWMCVSAGTAYTASRKGDAQDVAISFIKFSLSSWLAGTSMGSLRPR